MHLTPSRTLWPALWLALLSSSTAALAQDPELGGGELRLKPDVGLSVPGASQPQPARRPWRAG